MYAIMLNEGSSTRRQVQGWHPDPSKIDTSGEEIVERDSEVSEIESLALPWERVFYNSEDDSLFVEQIREPSEDDLREFNLSVDKAEITSDGQDTATVTASINPPELGNHFDAYFRVEGDTQASNTIDSNGEAVFEFASQTTGTFQLEVDIGGVQTERLYVEAV